MITQTTREPLYQECLQCGHEYSTAVGNLCPNDNSELVPVFSDSMEGITINEKYKIHSLCGSGAHGNVYRARHLALSKDVAIKFLHPHLIDNAAKLHRFENEARALSELSHPNIVKVIDFGLQPQPYIVMDYAAGKRLDQILEMVGSFPLKIAINVFLQICEGMAEVHAHGMIHQDLKPSNILVSKIETDAPEVKILDFGTAKLVVTDSEKTGEFVGSPPYMSPEQCGGEPTDARSDIYSLGCLMYEILTGQKPFKASTVEDYFFKHLNQLPEPPSRVAANIKIPEELDRIICRTLSKQVDFRVQSMEELANALKAVSTETMALTKSAVQDQAAMPGLPLIWPGLGAVSAVSLLTSLRTPAVPAELAHSPYLTYVIGLLSLFAVVYWVLAVLKLHKFAAAKKQCPEPTRGVAFFLFCNSLPVTPLIATAAMLCGTIMGGGLAASLAGWTLYLSYATFAFVCTFRYYTSLAGLTKDKTEITSDERRRIWLGVLLTFLLQCPAVTATLLGRYMDLELGMVLTCWAMGYVVLLVLKSEMERVFNRKTTKNSIGLILTLAFPFIVMCNGLLAWTISSVSNFTRQIATAPTAQLYFERGSWHRSATHYQLALNDYNKAAALAPADFWNLRRRGQVLNAMERHGEAIECFSKAIVQNKADQNILT